MFATGTDGTAGRRARGTVAAVARVAAALLATSLLAACGTPSGPPASDVEAVAGADPIVPVATLALPPDGDAWVRIEIPSPLRGGGLRLVVELDDASGSRPLDLVLYGADGVVPTASTSGSAYFRPGLAGIGEGFGSAEVGSARREPAAGRAVTVVGSCLGPCVARRVPTTLDAVYVRATNRASVAVDVPLHASVGEYIDPAEPLNDDRMAAATVAPDEPYTGALELLGDVDWVAFTADGTVTLEERPGYPVNARMRLFAAAPGGGVVDLGITLVPGGSVEVVAGDHGLIVSDPSEPRASVFGFYVVGYE